MVRVLVYLIGVQSQALSIKRKLKPRESFALQVLEKNFFPLGEAVVVFMPCSQLSFVRAESVDGFPKLGKRGSVAHYLLNHGPFLFGVDQSHDAGL